MAATAIHAFKHGDQEGALPARVLTLRRDLENSIPCWPDPASGRAELRKLNFSKLLCVYMNWAQRFIPPRQRNVHFSADFWDSPLAQEFSQQVMEMHSKIERGDDLTRHLSKYVQTHGYVSPRVASGARQRGPEWDDKDFALNGFGVHHLHFNEADENGGRPWTPKQELLYAMFGRHSAFLIIVGDHNSFDDGSLEAAVIRARAATDDYTLQGILPSRTPFSPKERTKLARRGFSVSADVGQKVVLSATVSRAGTSPLVTRHADRVLAALEDYDHKLDDSSFVRDLFAQVGREMPSQPDFVWQIAFCQLGLAEMISQTGWEVVADMR